MTYQDHLSYDTVIPMSMWFDKNLEPLDIKTYAIVRGLSNKYGFCFATNKYLSETLNVSDKTCRRSLTTLKKHGYLEIETEKNGIQWQRRIYISDKFKKSLRKVTDDQGGGHTRPGGWSPVTTIISINPNEEILDKREEADAPPHSSFEIYKRVKMESEKYQKLVKEFGQDKIKEMMERLDEYADINPKRFKQYACHGAVIRKWIREDDQKSKKTTSTPTIEQNKLLAQKILISFPKPVSENHIQLQSKGLLFCYTGCWEEINFSDNGFKDQVFSRLQKMGLPTNNL